MNQGRALLTPTDKERLKEQAGGQPVYQSRTHIRSRITDRLPDDMALLRDHEPEIHSLLQDTVCRGLTDQVHSPRITETSGTDPTHLITCSPAMETGQIARTQADPKDTSYGKLQEIMYTLQEEYRIAPGSGWFTIAQQESSITGNGPDAFLHYLHTPHATFSSNPDALGSALWFARPSHPGASIVAVSGQPKAEETRLRQTKVSIIGPEDGLEILPAVSDHVQFEEQSFTDEFFGGYTSHSYGSSVEIQLEPLEVVTDHHSPELATHPYEVLCQNPHFRKPEKWLDYLQADRNSFPDAVNEQIADELAATDRIRCFSSTNETTGPVISNDINIQHIPGFSDSFLTTNVTLFVEPA